MESIVAVSSITSAGYIVAKLHSELSDIDISENKARIKVVQLLVICVAAILWPFVQICVLNKEWKSGLLTQQSMMWICSTWVLILFCLDAAIIAYTPANNIDTASHQQREVKNTFLSVVSTVFAFGVLLSNIAKNDSGRSSRSAQICITGLMIGLAFAIPSFETEDNNFNNHLLLSVVKAACIWGVGIFMSGVVLELVVLSKKKIN